MPINEEIGSESKLVDREPSAQAHMVIVAKGGQEQREDCTRGLDRADSLEKMEAETQKTTLIDTTNKVEEMSSCSACRRSTNMKSVTLSMAENKDARYWAQDLKG